MGAPQEVSIPPRAAVELLHAEVAFLLGGAGTDVLHVKGPTVARWLHPDGGRPWGDADILLAPDQLPGALRELARHGFAERFPGVTDRTSEDHAVVLSRPAGSPGAGEVDLHHRFPGITAPPGAAFAALWRRRVPAELAHTAVWFPDLSSRALLVALNTARSADSPQALEDLRRLVRAEVDWDDVLALATGLAALPALRAGLELDVDGVALVQRLPGLRAVPVDPEWRLRTAGAPRTAVRVAELRRVPPARWAPTVGRWLLPHPAVLRMRDPRAGGGPGALALGYLRRLRDGLRSLPAALRALRGLRRRPH